MHEYATQEDTISGDKPSGAYRKAFASRPEETRARGDAVFEATDEWKEILDGQMVDAGIKVKLDMSTGKRFGKLISKVVEAVEDLAYLQKELSEGYVVDTQDPQGNTMLHRAVDAARLDCVKFLVEKGFSLSIFNKSFTPLHIAVQKGHLDVAKYLVEAKADLSVASLTGSYPLQLAAAAGHLEMVKFLASTKTDKKKRLKLLDQTNKRGNTALHMAGESGHLQVVQFLVAEGATVEILNNEGKSPAQVSEEMEEQEIADYLRKVVSDRVLDALMGDLEGEATSQKSGKKAGKKKGPEKGKEPETKPATAQPSSQSTSSSQAKGKKGKNQKKGKGKGGSSKASEAADFAAASAVAAAAAAKKPTPSAPTSASSAPTSAPSSAPSGGGGLVILDTQPVRTIAPPPKAKAKPVQQEESSEESSDDEPAMADLD